MVRIVGVQFKPSGKIYYFSPEAFDIKYGDEVIVETARGIEFGKAVIEPKSVSEKEIVTPLKAVIRMATENDKKKHQDNLAKKTSAIEICETKVAEHGLSMKLVDMEYTFDGNKVIFYFTADDRVDFRDLVKELAAIFRVRIELRQIGVRDQAKALGGLGPCGREVCCKKCLCEFCPVSIKMAKDQGISLNPSKISGLCGRLMCCLKYENDNYENMLEILPEVGYIVKTEHGKGTIIDRNVLLGELKILVKKDDGAEDIYKIKSENIRETGKKDYEFIKNNPRVQANLLEKEGVTS